MEKYPNLRLTIAFSKDDLARLILQQKKLEGWKRDRRLEPALRLASDAPLPLIYDMDLSKIYFRNKAVLPTEKIAWPDDVLVGIVKEKVKFSGFWGSQPKGFVAGGGSLSSQIAEILIKQKFSWTAAGFPDAEWADDEIMALDSGKDEPFQIMKAHGLSKLFYQEGAEFSLSKPCCVPAKLFVQKMVQDLERERSQAPVIVFDEARAKVTLDDFLKEVAVHLSTVPGVQTGTRLSLKLCSEIQETNLTDAQSASLQIWPHSWSWIKGLGNPSGPGLTTWVGDSAKNYAWSLLSQTRNEVEKYKNSGSADLAKLDLAMEEFYLAESGTFFEWFGSGVTEEERNGAIAQIKTQKQMLFKATLENVYRHLDLAVPNQLRRASFSGHSPKMIVPSRPSPNPVISAIPAAPTETAAFSTGTKKMVLEWEQADAAGSSTSTVKPENVSGSALKKFSLSISSSSGREWAHFTIVFEGSVLPTTVTDLYIDINHRPGAGNAALVAGRSASLDESDGWELLLVSRWLPSRGWTATLHRSLELSPPVYSAAIQYKTTSRPETTVFQIRIPKNMLGGNPSRWGFLLCAADASGTIKDFLSSSADKDNLLSEIKKGNSVPLPMIREEAIVHQEAAP